MKSDIQIIYHAMAVKMSFIDQEAAQVAYEKISAALKEYRLFKNERAETVEVDAEDGATTLRLERMDAVLFNRGAETETQLRASLEDEKLGHKLREELGLPPMELKR